MLWQPFSQSNCSVSFTRKLYQSLGLLVTDGLFYKLRFSVGSWRGINLKKLFHSNSTSKLLVNREEEVVVVGIGIAAFTFARSLYHLGFTNVTIIARDHLYGGKCVNFGCMPSEYYAVNSSNPSSDIIEQGQQFVAALRQATEQAFQDLNFPQEQAEVQEVKGKQIILNTGEQISFDRLVLATGNRPTQSPLVQANCSLADFWQIKSGKLLIISSGNVAALSYADIAIERGLEVTVAFESSPLLMQLPSFRYFRRELEKRGIRVILNVNIQRQEDQTVEVKIKGKSETLEFEHLMYDGAPELNLPRIDGQTVSVLDLDLRRAQVVGREDIYVLGDASGFLSATEAEVQAKQLAKSWASGADIQVSDLERLPLRLHARQSLAIVGPPWALLLSNWKSVDFKTLGWSAIHNETGKLWYLFNKDEDKVEAIHICHRNASELISLASVLIDLPISDNRWLTSAVHPSAAEIFKVLIEDIESNFLIEYDDRDTISSLPENIVLRIPPASQMEWGDFYHKTFTQEECCIGILDQNPSIYFATLLGLKSLLRSEERQQTIPLRRSKNNDLIAEGISFDYEEDLSSSAVTVTLNSRNAIVYVGSLNGSL